MLIKKLKLTNFRVFKGENEFDLSPESENGSPKPIILFGGLNGSGKTSILTGIRLALYGRNSLGHSVSQKKYDQFLLNSIHNSPHSEEEIENASVELSFTYAKLGTETEYQIIRKWFRRNDKVKESLEIFQNSKAVKGLSYDQAQSFLNELIPIGVSELFFFDGEKIASLADDSSGLILERSIKKLLGLDIVERLSGDLEVIRRNISKKTAVNSVQKQIDLDSLTLKECERIIEEYRLEISTLNTKRFEIEKQIDQIRRNLEEKGGSFYQNKTEIEEKLDALQEKKKKCTANIISLLSDATPLAVADEFSRKVEERIEFDINRQQDRNIYHKLESAFKGALTKIKPSVSGEAFTKISEEFSGVLLNMPLDATESVVHDLTPKQAAEIFSSFNKARLQKKALGTLFSDLEVMEKEISELAESLLRVPDDSALSSEFIEMQELQRKAGKVEERLAITKDNARKEVSRALTIARQLDRLYEKAAKESDEARVLGYISNTSSVLSEFNDKMSDSKIADLEAQFEVSFSRLARKNDMALGIKINRKTFQVSLVDINKREIEREKLSAGEKQIFAVAILEALAKTSGRALPMIIDTPLGRLDSSHRRNLVENYFQTASHQMIVLSTDTEIDKSYLKHLRPSISRAFQLDYDQVNGFTSVVKNYFWNVAG
ncbi:DNA sulfur modification protein DndD [Saccharospirillum mangrovi]|uniref:DNA sulfur modification protein DndD n=1 Tax=Saccharospirillum mangrovi TaxID=2161747 RepID=UPI000D3B7B01|nr:DNA sulfur modification protein DndD [Saccharospirillum mangrovi]